MPQKIDRVARRVVKSVARLSHRRALMAPLDLIDRTLGAPFAEFRVLPPNHLRIRAGIGNRLLCNQALFLEIGARNVMYLLTRSLLRTDSRVVDIGCGCGRFTLALERFGFRGSYTGVDVDREALAWCRQHFPHEHYGFHHADVFSQVYNPTGSRQPFVLPVESGTQDLVVGHSLLTHLLEDDVHHYLKESARVLDVGGSMMMTVFCIEDMQEAGLLGGRWTFQRRSGNAYLEHEDVPEAAVAYTRDFLLKAGHAAGFVHAELEPGHAQSALTARR